MTAAELTTLTAQIGSLSLADQEAVGDYVRSLLRKRDAKVLTEDEYFDKYFPKYTVEDLLKLAEEADREYAEGKCLTYEEAKEIWRKEYGVSV